MAEGARLEIVWAVLSRLEGSNPSLSAKCPVGAPTGLCLYPRCMRKLPVLLAALMALAILAPAQAQAHKPEIIYVRATDDNEGIRFTAKVKMDKRAKKSRKVSVTFSGERKKAVPLFRPPLSMYETGAYSTGVRNCYSVTVTATDRFGTTIENVRAGLLGTNGCN